MNKPPSCSITSPASNSSNEVGSIVQIQVNTSDADGSVTSVKTSIDDTEKSTLNSTPYAYEWNTTGTTVGPHVIKAVATDNGGLTAMSQITVNITSKSATITTSDITEITASGTSCGGNITDDGGSDISARGVVWNNTSGVSLTNKLGSTTDGSGSGAFVSTIADLTANTTYYVKAYATNNKGTAYGEEKSFKTIALATVVMGNITDITSNSATVDAEITDDGGSVVTERGFVWKSDASEPTINDNDGKLEVGSGTGVFSSSIGSLTNYTDYYIQAYATTANGTSYGGVYFFQTLAAKPTVTTSIITKPSAHWAVSCGTITDTGGPTDIYRIAKSLIWSTYPNPEFYTSEGIADQINILTDNSYECIISGLAPNTKYYVRALAYWDAADIAYGEVISFTTPDFSVQTSTFTDTRDNTVYPTITINNQIWMAQNLAYLPEVCPSTSNCRYWVYDYQGTNVANAKATSNYSTYGVLYNLTIANDVCPVGWHLPTPGDWSMFKMNLGMPHGAAYSSPSGWWWTNEGGKMKEAGTTHWADPNTGATNISKFTALPGGMRDIQDNTFKQIGTNAYFWEHCSGSCTWHVLDYLNEAIYIPGWSLSQDILGYGFSVGCIKD